MSATSIGIRPLHRYQVLLRHEGDDGGVEEARLGHRRHLRVVQRLGHLRGRLRGANALEHPLCERQHHGGRRQRRPVVRGRARAREGQAGRDASRAVLGLEGGADALRGYPLPRLRQGLPQRDRL